MRLAKRTEVVFSPAYSCFINFKKGTRYTGLVNVLRKAYYPDYSPKDAKHGKDEAFPEAATSKPAKRPARWAFVAKTKGEMNPGTALENDLALILKGLRGKPKTVSPVSARKCMDWFMTPTASDDDSKCKSKEANRKKLLLPLVTEDVLQLLHEKKWDLLETQLVVWNNQTKIATAVDLVCWDAADKKYVLIELKLGYKNYYKHTGQSMRGPVRWLNDCAYNQHQLQLCCTSELFETCYKTTNYKSFLVRLSRNGVELSPLTKLLEQYQNAISTIAFSWPKRRSADQCKISPSKAIDNDEGYDFPRRAC